MLTFNLPAFLLHASYNVSGKFLETVIYHSKTSYSSSSSSQQDLRGERSLACEISIRPFIIHLFPRVSRR